MGSIPQKALQDIVIDYLIKLGITMVQLLTEMLQDTF